VTLAIVFPGQGSQSVGMLGGLAQAHPLVEETFAVASHVLGYDLGALVRDGPEASLNRTERAQPALLAAGVAVWRVWRARGGPEPVCMAGHSLGEYTALVCAGGLELEEAIGLVADRGRFMQEAVPEGEGAMAAILGLGDAEVEAACAVAAEGEVVSAANYNSPGQVVVAGGAAAVARVVERARSAGAKRAVMLAVSVPSHCELMAGAARRLQERLAEVVVRVPRIPVFHNVDGRTRSDPGGIRAALADQVRRPVRWVECVRAMAGQGVTEVVEMGPGKVLTGLTPRIVAGMGARSVGTPAGLHQALVDLGGAGR
jgi:[acyl-carrier-protein] S-malonyltransferase